MKILSAKGVGGTVKKAKCITIDEEELLWSKGVLGDHSPEALLNTVFLHEWIVLRFEICQQLRHSPCQIQIIEKTGETPYLQYTKDISKNNPGGL